VLLTTVTVGTRTLRCCNYSIILHDLQSYDPFGHFALFVPANSSLVLTDSSHFNAMPYYFHERPGHKCSSKIPFGIVVYYHTCKLVCARARKCTSSLQFFRTENSVLASMFDRCFRRVTRVTLRSSMRLQPDCKPFSVSHFNSCYF
jgi:hypothetical protein